MARRKSEQPKRPETAAADALKALDDGYLECRDLRHPWAVVGYFRDDGHVCRRLLCERCEMVRIDRWLPNGGRDTPRYYAPEGFHLIGTRATGQDVRVEVLRRVRGTVARSERALLGEG